MKSLIGLLIIALAALFGSRLVERSGPVPDFFRRLFSGAPAYLFIGLALGPSFLGLITDQVLLKLSPLVTIALFWIGFLYGLHCRGRDLKRIPGSVFLFSLGQALVPFVVLALAFFFFFHSYFDSLGPPMAAAITLAACASGTSQSTVLRLTRHHRFRGPTARLAAVAATLDDLPAIIATGLVTFFIHKTLPHETPLSGLVWLISAVGLGLLGGVLMKVLLQRAENSQARLLVIMGCMAVGGGIAAYLHLSPIFIGAVMGAVYANLGAEDREVFDLVHRSESTFYVLFLILVGSMIHAELASAAFYALIYITLRTLSKVAGGFLFLPPKKVPGTDTPSHWIGLALLSQGGMAIALAIHYRGVYASPIADMVVTIILIGVVVNELIAYPLALRVAGRDRVAP